MICKQPGHLASIKKLLGNWMFCFNLCFVFSLGSGFNKSISMSGAAGWVPTGSRCGSPLSQSGYGGIASICFELIWNIKLLCDHYAAHKHARLPEANKSGHPTSYNAAAHMLSLESVYCLLKYP